MVISFLSCNFFFFFKIRHHLQLILLRVKNIWTRVHSFIIALYNTNNWNILNRYVRNPFLMIGFLSYCFKWNIFKHAFFKDNFCVLGLANWQFKIYRIFHSWKTNKQTIMILRWNNVIIYFIVYVNNPERQIWVVSE